MISSCEYLRRGRALQPIVVAAAVVVLFAARAAATPLAVGTSIHAVGENDPTGGAIVAGGTPLAFTSATFSGTLTTDVISGDPSNPYGGLTFTYLLSNDSISPDQIERLTINSFAGFQTDVSYQIPALGTIPDISDRSGSGNTIGFTFNGPPVSVLGTLLPGHSSALLVIQTNATHYASTTANVIDGSVTSVATYGPIALIPEPSSMVLAGLGLAALAAVGYRRRRAS
jgi:hypothetical protein